MKWLNDLKEKILKYILIVLFSLFVSFLCIAWVYSIVIGICDSDNVNKISFANNICKKIEVAQNTKNVKLVVLFAIFKLLALDTEFGGKKVMTYLGYFILLLQTIAIPILIYIDDSNEPGLSNDTIILIAIISISLFLHMFIRIACFFGKTEKYKNSKIPIFIQTVVDYFSRITDARIPLFDMPVVLTILTVLIMSSISFYPITDFFEWKTTIGKIIFWTFATFLILSAFANNIDKIINGLKILYNKITNSKSSNKYRISDTTLSSKIKMSGGGKKKLKRRKKNIKKLSNDSRV